MKIQKMKMSEITPYFNNARDNSAAIQPTKASIERYGFVKPIIVDKDGVIIAGHTRYVASFQLGLTEVPVVVSDLNEEKAKAYRIADNKLAEKSHFDEQALIDELRRMEVPAEMQEFFFEDVDTMLNGDIPDFNTPTMSYSGNDEAAEASTGEQSSQMQGQSETDTEEETEEETHRPYVPYYEDGKMRMLVVCPYCNNVEEIEL